MASSTTQRNDPALLSRARRLAVLIGALLVVALGTGAVVWSWSPAPPPPENATTIADAAASGDARAATCVVTPPESRARSEVATRTAVVGKALDSGGGPLAGFSVALQRVDPKPVPIASLKMQLEPTTPHGGYPPVYAECDAAGGFAFESLDAGKYRCRIAGLELPAETFALGSGEVRELTLRSPLVALTLTFLRRGEVAQDCVVQFSNGKEPHTLLPGKAGVSRSFAAPGRYEVIVHLEPRADHSRTRGPCLCRHVLVVPDGVPALQWSFETGGTEIAFAVEDPQGQAIDTYTIDIEGIGAFDQVPGHYVLFGKPGEPAAMAALPAGQWRATVTSDGFRVDPRDFVTGLDDGRVVLSFVARPAAYVRLLLRESAPFPADPEPREMPALVADGCAIPCRRAGIGEAVARRGHLVRGAGVALAFDYCAVPPGKATLCFQDRIEGDELVPLPFDPIAPVTIDVALGCANEVGVDVEPRAFVDLRGCDASGMEMITAVVTVWVDGRRARNRDAKTSQRWLGWLPRGVHRVVVDRNGTQREHVLQVERMYVNRRYRP